MNQLNLFALLGVAFIIKHVLADFALQTPWMAERKEAASGWALPLAAHCACHMTVTVLIVLVAVPSLWWLAVVDFVVHATIDRGKGLAVRHAGFAPTQDKGWWLILATDQALHQLTHLGFAYAMVFRTFAV